MNYKYCQDRILDLMDLPHFGKLFIIKLIFVALNSRFFLTCSGIFHGGRENYAIVVRREHRYAVAYSFIEQDYVLISIDNKTNVTLKTFFRCLDSSWKWVIG